MFVHDANVYVYASFFFDFVLFQFVMQGGIILFFAGACAGIWAHKQALEGGMFSIVWSSQWRAEFAFGKKHTRTYTQTHFIHLYSHW